MRRGAGGTEEPAPDEELAGPFEPFDAERAGDHPLVDDSDTLIPGGESGALAQDTAEIDMDKVIRAEPEEEDFDDGSDEAQQLEPEPAAPASAAPEHAGPEEPEVEDVLEETPSFLQQTPEHDRLWFEQQPPRDFDFDK